MLNWSGKGGNHEEIKKVVPSAVMQKSKGSDYWGIHRLGKR